MEGYLYHHQQQQQQTSTETAAAAAGDRFPQWSAQETKEFLAVRAELDRAFMETKRNKALWEVMAARLKEMGFSRSAEQCKSKWKNLVTRYKGCETMEPEALRQQFPYYNELHAIFSARLHHMLWAEAEAATPSGGPTSSSISKKRKTVSTTTTTTSVQMSSDDDDDDDVEERESNDEDDYEENIKKAGSSKRGGKKKKKKNSTKGDETEVTELLERFTRQQSETEARWRETWEAREAERRKREDTWRSTMEALEAERRRMERSWREGEEQRRVREEARAIKRDALITLLLNKLSRDDNI